MLLFSYAKRLVCVNKVVIQLNSTTDHQVNEIGVKTNVGKRIIFILLLLLYY